MSDQIEADDVAQFVSKAANFDTPSGVSVTVEFDDGTSMNRTWGKIEATPESMTETTTTETPETAPERNEAEIRDAWAKIAEN